MKWFRFYHEAYRNPKVQEMRAELFKFWINFLCVASESEERGTVASEAHLRLALGLTKPTTKRYVDELEALSLLHRTEQGALRPHDWDELQPDSDDSAKRQRDKRARDSGESPSRNGRDTSRDTSRDKNVTSRARALSELELDQEAEQSCAAPLERVEPEYPEPDGLYMVMPGPHAVEEKTARELWSLFWKGWKSEKICIGFYQHQRFYKPASWRESIRRVATGQVTPGTIGYFETIAADCDVNGVPDQKPRVGTKSKFEDNGKTAVQQDPKDTVAALQRPKFFADDERGRASKAIWDQLEADQRRKNGVAT